MTFLQTTMLWGLFAVSIPVIIHLLNRRRFRTVEWGAMQFLLRATRESRGKKRLKHIVILVMRSLAIAALIFAIARPLVGGLLGWGAGRVETVILILDRSPSMERIETDGRTSKRASVLKRVADAVSELGEARLVLIDSATGRAQEVPSPEVLPELSATASTDAAADIPGLLNSALDYIQEAQPGRSEIWIASDLQREDWSPTDNRWDAFRASLKDLDLDVKLRILALSGRERNDHSIRVVAARREAGDLVLELEISREADLATETIPITVNHLGARTASQVIMSGQSQRFQKRIPLEGRAEGGYGWVSIPDSANQRNNVAYYAYGAEAPVQSYLVAENSTGLETLEALTKGLAPGFANQEVTVLSPERAHAINYDLASLVVWKAPLPTPPISDQLLDYVRGGGVCLFFPSETESESDPSFGSLAWKPVNESEPNKTFNVEEWDHADGAFRDSVDGTPLPVKALRAFKRRGITGEFTSLVNWFDKEPLLARRVIENGRIVFFTTLPDYTWSNLELTALHLVLLQRSLDEGSLRLGAGFFGVAGRDSARPQGEEIRTLLDTASDLPEGSGESDFEAGVYRFGERTVAVNRPVEEDSIEMMSNAQLEASLVDTNYSLLEERSASNDPLLREAWRAFLIAMLLFLIAEAILCLQPRRVETGKAPTPQPTT